MNDPAFMELYSEIWFELREGLLSMNAINTRIDDYVTTLSEAKERNFERWPDMLTTSYSQVYVYNIYDEYIVQMKDWGQNKFEWLDIAFEDNLMGIKESNDDFITYDFIEQTDDFTVEFDWSPQNENMDGVFAVTDISKGVDVFQI